MTTKTVIPLPMGESFVKVYSEGETYCNNCDCTFDTDDWSETLVYDPEQLGNWISRNEVYIDNEDERSVFELFGQEGIKTITKMECPNGCTYVGGEGDSWWHITDTQYVCTDCNEWHDVPHWAQTCCGDCNEGGERDYCHCDNMVQVNPDGTPVLLEGQPMSRCLCGEGDCDMVVCLICHGHWDAIDVVAHMRDEHPGEEWELQVPDTIVGTVNGVTMEQFNMFVALQDNTMPTSAQPPTKAKCEICSSYCCAIHKTHSSPHQFCWENT